MAPKETFSGDAENGDDEARAACARREGHGGVGTGATANPLERFIAFRKAKKNWH